MEHEIDLKWLKEMAFEGTQPDGYKIKLDAAETPAINATKPKPLLLTALAGCTGMDVASLLKKMRIEVKDLNIKVKGILTDEHPKYYRSMHITYQFAGNNLDREKIEKIISMSQEKYCGVSALFRMAIPVTYTVELIEV